MGLLKKARPRGPEVLRHLDRQSWPLSKLGEAIVALARMNRLVRQRIELPTPPQGLIAVGVRALDPETLQQVMRCVLERSRTLMVIAHS